MTALKRSNISVKPSLIQGWGVFAAQDISAGDIIEQCYVLLFNDYNEKLCDYTFDVTKIGYETDTGLPLGYGAIYNHSDNPNASYKLDEETFLLNFYARRAIRSGEEILIRYGDDWFSCRDVVPRQASLRFRIKWFFATHRGMVRMGLVTLALILGTILARDIPISFFYNL